MLSAKDSDYWSAYKCTTNSFFFIIFSSLLTQRVRKLKIIAKWFSTMLFLNFRHKNVFEYNISRINLLSKAINSFFTKITYDIYELSAQFMQKKQKQC